MRRYSPSILQKIYLEKWLKRSSPDVGAVIAAFASARRMGKDNIGPWVSTQFATCSNTVLLQDLQA